jgi:O-antigen ligase
VTGAPATGEPRRWPGSLAAVGLVVAVAGATVGIVLVTGNPVLAVLPAGALLVWQILDRVPLRLTAALLLFLALVPDDRGETPEQWHTPLAYLGDLMVSRLDQVGLPGLPITGLEALCGLVLVLALRRRGAEARADLTGRYAGIRELRILYAVYLAGVLLALALGMAKGQGLVPWKLRNLLHPLLLSLVFGVAFRGPADHRLIARVVVFAGCFRAVLAIIVQRISIAQSGGKFATATSHGDSVLFAVAIFILLAELMERPPGMRPLRTFLLLPILLAGAQQNGRRLVWVMLVQMLALAYLFFPFRGWKRTLTRAVVFGGPVVVLYLAVGWNAQSRIFAPVQTLRSVTDTSVDHSAYWREVENWNLANNIRESPLIGHGLGGRYSEYMYNDDISTVYREYREWPHNTVLGMLFLMGLVGFVTVWWLWVGLVYVLARAYRHATDPEHRTAALGMLGCVMACHGLAYGDTGAHYPQYKIFMGLALALGPKLALACGAWPARRRAVPQGPTLVAEVL